MCEADGKVTKTLEQGASFGEAALLQMDVRGNTAVPIVVFVG